MIKVISGKVVKGKGLGRKIGFPTVNILYEEELSGIFAGKVYFNGKGYVSAVHIGRGLTFDDGEAVCESYLIDFNEEIKPGTHIKVELLKKIRDTKKFDDLKTLKKNISKDVEFIKNMYNLD
ncbi:hypothetical protein GF366_03390 [Candidatus Peregrinibacteria bacterium]|nr:hypothetical protein [Candidatus Peregrinibacteria bacterium]